MLKPLFVRALRETVTHFTDCRCGKCFIHVAGKAYHSTLTAEQALVSLNASLVDNKAFVFEAPGLGLEFDCQAPGPSCIVVDSQ